MAYAGGNEEVAWGLIYRVEHGQILDPLLVEELDEPATRPAKLVLYGRCHQLSADASIA